MHFIKDDRLTNIFTKAVEIIENAIEEHKKNNPGVSNLQIPLWENTKGGGKANLLGTMLRGLEGEDFYDVTSELSMHFEEYDAKFVMEPYSKFYCELTL